MDQTVKILYLTTNQILISELVEVAPMDIGAPDCKMVNPFAIKEALPLIKKYGVRLKLINGLFSNIEQILKELKIQRINGITFDFGVSSPQLENHKRGFSFKLDGPLDMRMNLDDEITASEVLNQFEEEDIANILYKYSMIYLLTVCCFFL